MTPTLIGLALCSTVGCSSSLPAVWVTDLPAQKQQTKILVGDEIEVKVKDQGKLSGKYPVRPNGTYAQPIVGDLAVVGLTEIEAAQVLSKNLKGIVVSPLVTVTITKRKPIEVPVLGEVRTIGTVTVQLGDGLLKLLAKVGGITDFASKTGIYVLRRDPTLTRIRFDYNALLGGDRKHVEFQLQEGDVVVVK